MARRKLVDVIAAGREVSQDTSQILDGIAIGHQFALRIDQTANARHRATPFVRLTRYRSRC
jgi:hypothetical protein